MPAPYSIDLRKRVINAYEAHESSQRQLSKRFQVSLSFVKSLISRYRKTGEISPKPHGGGAKAVIKQSQLKQVQQLVNEQPDA
jgi:transposase